MNVFLWLLFHYIGITATKAIERDRRGTLAAENVQQLPNPNLPLLSNFPPPNLPSGTENRQHFLNQPPTGIAEQYQPLRQAPLPGPEVISNANAGLVPHNQNQNIEPLLNNFPIVNSNIGSAVEGRQLVENVNPFISGSQVFQKFPEPIGNQVIIRNIIRTVHIKEPFPVPQPIPIRIVKEIPVPQPYPVHITKTVPVPVHIRVPYEVPKPYAVKVPHPVPVPYQVKVPVEVPKPYPIHITRTVTIPVEKQVQVQVPYPVKVPVAQPYPVAVPHPVEVRVPHPVFVKVPEFIKVPSETSQVVHTGAPLFPINVANDESVSVEAAARAQSQAIAQSSVIAQSESITRSHPQAANINVLADPNGQPLQESHSGHAEAEAQAKVVAQFEAISQARAAADKNSLNLKSISNVFPAPNELPHAGQLEAIARAQQIAQSEAVFRARAAADRGLLHLGSPNNHAFPLPTGQSLPVFNSGQAEAAARAQSIAQFEAISQAREAADRGSLNFRINNNAFPVSNGPPLPVLNAGPAETEARAQAIAQSEAIYQAQTSAHANSLNLKRVSNVFPTPSHIAAAAQAQAIAQSEAVSQARVAADRDSSNLKNIHNAFALPNNFQQLPFPNEQINQFSQIENRQAQSPLEERHRAQSIAQSEAIAQAQAASSMASLAGQFPLTSLEGNLGQAEVEARAVAESQATAQGRAQADSELNAVQELKSNELNLGPRPTPLNIGEKENGHLTKKRASENHRPN